MPLPSFVRTHGRLVAALACYLVLIAITLYVLLPIHTSNDRFILGFVLCFFAILIIKTIVHTAQDRDSE
jgi:hypothetical protein